MALMSTRGAGSARNYGTLSKRTQIFKGTPQQNTYTTDGTYTWVCPPGVTSVCVLCIGQGGGGGTVAESRSGGGGGGVAMKNNIAVTPGASYTVVVAPGGLVDSYTTYRFASTTFSDAGTTYVLGGSGWSARTIGSSGGIPGGFNPDGIGDILLLGGQGGTGYLGGGGGGAGGGGFIEDFVGGKGGWSDNFGGQEPAVAGRNGGAGGGAGVGGGFGGNPGTNTGTNAAGGGGFGVFGGDLGVVGEGGGGQLTNGITYGGYGGSGGETGRAGSASAAGTGGRFGGGGGGGPNAAPGAGGAVRIIWGAGRAYPNTNTGDVYV